MNEKGLAKPLKMAMVDKGITQAKVADEIGITAQSLNNLLKRDNITYNRAVAIAEVLGCEIVLMDKATKRIY